MEIKENLFSHKTSKQQQKSKGAAGVHPCSWAMQDGLTVCTTQSPWLSSGGMETSTKHPHKAMGPWKGLCTPTEADFFLCI